ncbi:MAG: hypothetical protein Q3976_07885 [Corynebacterium sp.]|nr:hypothetical protein [Corynebacterium sp.]
MRRTGDSTVIQPVTASRPYHVWSIDFQFYVTADGNPFKIVSMLDEFTRKPLVDMAQRSVAASDLCSLLTSMFAHAASLKSFA